MEKIDFKKIYKDYYMPKRTPSIVKIPALNYIAVEGKGDPNEENGQYAKAVALLYAMVFTIKMSKMGQHKLDGYYEYVMPPLEGLWWMPSMKDVDLHDKSNFHFISMIAQPDFVNEGVFEWACDEVSEKKGLDTSNVKFMSMNEGMCVTCMHIGSYDNEQVSIEKMDEFAKEQGYVIDINDERLHHEIYLSDPRKTKAENLKTVLRLPIKKDE